MINKQNKLLLAIPTWGSVDYRFAMSLASLVLPDMTTLMMTPRTMIDTARNLITEKFLKDPSYTHLLMIDDDHIFETNLASELLSHDVDIVGALAFKRRPDYQPCVYRKNKKDDKYYPILPEVFQEVDIVGTGAILIKREVFEKLSFPYFWTGYDEDGIHWSVDFNFSIAAKKAGFKIFVDPKVEIKHIGDPVVIDKNTFLNSIIKSKDNIKK